MDAIALSLKPLFVGRPNSFPGALDGATLIDLRDNMTRTTRSGMALVFGAVGAVFLIACVNVIGLLLAHGEDRNRELALRTAIGAGRGRLMRQLLVEAGLLALIGGVVGWLESAVAFGVIVSQIPQWMQVMGEPRLGLRATTFAAILALLTLLVSGIIPAIRSSSQHPRAALAAGTRQAPATRRSKHVLIFLEVALATILLCAGSIMVRSWINLHTQETGMDAERVIAVRAAPAGIADAARRARHNAIIAEAVLRAPGVESVALIDMPLLQGAVKGSGFIPPAQVRHPAGMDTDVMVTPGYFATMGMMLRMGRGLSPADRERGVVISDSLAKRYWPGRSPVGETIRYRDGRREIVGVMSDARDVSLDSPPVPTLYHVWDDANPPIATIVARFSGPAATVMRDIRLAVRMADDAAAITMLSTVDQLLSSSVAERNFNTLLFGAFGAAGLLVALVGIYGLVAFTVAQREREMGIRLALGASGRELTAFIMSGTLRWVAAGLVVGVGTALFCAQYLKPFVYQIPPSDPVTLAAVAVLFVVVAATATYLPARRAARVDPVVALRAE
jgi:predicted permease